MKDFQMAAKDHDHGLDAAAYVTPQIRSFSPAEFFQLVGPAPGASARAGAAAETPPVGRRSVPPRRDDH